MNLIYIYGPPASGKLTVAKELAVLTGYSLFHNHQTRDIVHELYPNTLSDNYSLVHKLRLDIFEYAAKHETNLIFTFVYDDPEDQLFIDKAIKAVKDNKGTVYFVETTASNEVLLSRVDNNSRKEHRKLTDKVKLEKLLSTDPYKSLPYEGVLKIDTGTLSPAGSALAILKHYNL
jgi:cytidylate kinase